MFSMDPWDREEKGIFIKSAWQALLPDRTAPKENYEYLDDIESLPLGKIIAIADLVDCLRIVNNPGTNIDIAKHIPIGAESLTNDKHHPDFGKYIVPTAHEMLFGDWTPGRYAWEFANVKMLPEPIPAKGQQRLWNWEDLK